MTDVAERNLHAPIRSLTGVQIVGVGSYVPERVVRTEDLAAIGADCTSRVVAPQDVKTYPLLGDGAGAVPLTRGSPAQGLVAYALGADGSGFDRLNCPMGGSRLPASAERLADRMQYLKMEGR